MPFYLLLVAYACVILLRKERPILPHFSLIRTLAIGGFVVLLCSSVMLFYVDVGHLRRVHFVISIMFLLFAFTTVPVLIAFGKVAETATLHQHSGSAFARVHSCLFASHYSWAVYRNPTMRSFDLSALFQIVTNQRIFMLGEGLRRVAPFVTLQSFVEAREGRYYHQDPKTASELYQGFSNHERENCRMAECCA